MSFELCEPPSRYVKPEYDIAQQRNRKKIGNYTVSHMIEYKLLDNIDGRSLAILRISQHVPVILFNKYRIVFDNGEVRKYRKNKYGSRVLNTDYLLPEIQKQVLKAVL